MCAAGATSLFPSFFLSSPSIFASFIFSLPPTHLLHPPKRPQIQLPPGSSGRQTQLHRSSWKEILICNMSSIFIMGVTSLQAELQRWPKTEPGWKATISDLIKRWSMAENTRKVEQRMWCSSTPFWLIRACQEMRAGKVKPGHLP